MSVYRILAILGLITIGVLSRLLPHPPNFTSLNAIALFSTIYFQDRRLSIATMFSIMLISDLVIGFHSTMPFVYLSFGLIILAAYKFKNVKYLQNLYVKSLCASFIFFIVANFGTWITCSFYPKTLSGLSLCYMAAIPFLIGRIIGDFFYISILASCLYASEKFIFNKKSIY